VVSFGADPLSVSMDSSEIFLLIEQVKDPELLSQGRIGQAVNTSVTSSD
ncbi:uncharacterized protein METZ01_LOCUS202943, partial [marine metagenome]